MPFIKKIQVEKGILGIWSLNDPLESLINQFQFTEKEREEFKKFRFEKRQKEYLAARLLLQQITNGKAEIEYNQSGCPHIKNSEQHLSISHSADFVVVFVSNENVGVDVENVNRNIGKVANRFLHQTETEWIGKTGNSQFLKILLWCAKEAVFKCSRQSGIQFDTQILIDPFRFDETDCFNGTLTTISNTEYYTMWYFYFENNIIVYCVEVKNNFQ